MVSTLGGPIPPHPYYESEANQFAAPGRTRPEGEEFLLKGRGTVGALLAIEGQSVFSNQPPPRRHKPEPKDHVKDNVRRMRQIQRDTRKAQQEASKPVKALWKTNRFDGVQSRVQQDLEEREQIAASRPQSANYLRAHSRTGFNTPTRPQSAGAVKTKKPTHAPIPRPDSALELKHNDFDFVKINGIAARHANMRRSPSLTALDDLKKKQEDSLHKYQKGVVPKYLQNRQRQWREEEDARRAAEPDPEMPAGHRQMSNNERRDTLDKLQTSLKEIQSKMASLPVRNDTHHIRHKKGELEKQMAEIEEAIRIFSRPKVFVRMDT